MRARQQRLLMGDGAGSAGSESGRGVVRTFEQAQREFSQGPVVPLRAEGEEEEVYDDSEEDSEGGSSAWESVSGSEEEEEEEVEEEGKEEEDKSIPHAMSVEAWHKSMLKEQQKEKAEIEGGGKEGGGKEGGGGGEGERRGSGSKKQQLESDKDHLRKQLKEYQDKQDASSENVQLISTINVLPTREQVAHLNRALDSAMLDKQKAQNQATAVREQSGKLATVSREEERRGKRRGCATERIEGGENRGESGRGGDGEGEEMRERERERERERGGECRKWTSVGGEGENFISQGPFHLTLSLSLFLSHLLLLLLFFSRISSRLNPRATGSGRSATCSEVNSSFTWASTSRTRPWTKSVSSRTL